MYSTPLQGAAKPFLVGVQGQFVRFLCMAFYPPAYGSCEDGLCVGQSGCLKGRISWPSLKMHTRCGRGQILFLALTCCESPGMFLCLSDPQFPHLSNGDNNSCFYAIGKSIDVHKSLSTVPGAHLPGIQGPGSAPGTSCLAPLTRPSLASLADFHALLGAS